MCLRRQTEEEALDNVREAAQAYIEVLIEDVRPVPGTDEGVAIVDGAAVVVAA